MAFYTDAEKKIKSAVEQAKKGGNKERAIAQPTADALLTFCKQNEEIAEAVKKAKEDAKAESKELEETVANLKAETAELEKRLKASDGDTQKFLIYMQSFQDYLNKALSIVNGLEKEQKDKMQNAVIDVLKKILNQIEQKKG